MRWMTAAPAGIADTREPASGRVKKLVFMAQTQNDGEVLQRLRRTSEAQRLAEETALSCDGALITLQPSPTSSGVGVILSQRQLRFYRTPHPSRVNDFLRFE